MHFGGVYIEGGFDVPIKLKRERSQWIAITRVIRRS